MIASMIVSFVCAEYAARREKASGPLEPGKFAGLIVLSQNLFEIEPTENGKTEVGLTMVGRKMAGGKVA